MIVDTPEEVGGDDVIEATVVIANVPEEIGGDNATVVVDGRDGGWLAMVEGPDGRAALISRSTARAISL